MRTLLKIIFFAIIGLISYNYFFGTEVEKARSEQVVDSIKDVFVSIKDLVTSEKEKVEDGKYDKALDKIGGLFRNFKNQNQGISDGLKERLADLEIEKERLEERIVAKKKETLWTEAEKEKTKEDFEALIKKTEELFQEAGQ